MVIDCPNGTKASNVTLLTPEYKQVLDFIILMGTLAEYIADAFGYSSFTVKSFRILRILRVLCYFKTLSEIRSYIATLQRSAVSKSRVA